MGVRECGNCFAGFVSTQEDSTTKRVLFLAPAFHPYLVESPYSGFHFMQKVAAELKKSGAAEPHLAVLSGSRFSASAVLSKLLDFAS